ncbi:MAG: fibronectin type III domain-containing protein [Mycobacteriales bacterium]
MRPGPTAIPLLAAAVLVAGAAAAPARARAGAGPEPPRGLRVPTLAVDDTSATLVWERPADGSSTVDYHVYRDGRLAGDTATASSAAAPHLDRFEADPANAAQVRIVRHAFTATHLRPATRYRFTVRAVDAAGHESRDSAPRTVTTTHRPAVFDVTDYGAVGDGSTLDTRAIQAAIDACTPGGKVVIPAGVFRSGALWLKSDMTFQVAAGGTLLGSDDAADYPYDFLLYDYSTDPRFHSLLNAQTWDDGSLHDVRVVGPGTIDGDGWKRAGVDAEGFPISAPSSAGTVNDNGVLARAQVARAAALGSANPYGTRSNLITLRGVTRAYLGGFDAVNPSFHDIAALRTRDLTVDGVGMKTYNINNGDGLDFGNSTGLTVVNSVFDTGDDSLNFAAGLGAASPADGPSGDAWIAGNYFRHGHGAVVAGSHTGGWIRNIVAEDNVVDRSDVGLRMKTNPANGGGVRNVLFQYNALRSVGQQAFIFTSAYSDPSAAIVVEPAATKALFEDVTVRHVTVDGTGKESIGVLGVPDRYHRRLRFDDVHFLDAHPASIAYLRDSTFHDVVFDRTPEPWAVTSSTGLRFTGRTTATAVTADAARGPAWPRGASLTATAVTGTAATLAWPAATDPTAVASYVITRDGGVPVATVPGTALTASVTGLSPALAYRFAVRAVDATGNAAGGPAVDVTTTGVPDVTAPTVPAGAGAFTAVPGGTGTTWAALRWLPATDTYGVAGYRISVDGRPVGTAAGDATAFVATRLAAGTTHTVTLRALDASGNAAAYPVAVTVTTLPPYDTGAPRWPRGARLVATGVTSGSVTLRWTPAVDDQRVVGYRVYRDGRPVPAGAVFSPVDGAATTAGDAYTVTGLAPGSTYVFTVQAGDTVDRWSGSGPSVRVTTTGGA